MSELYLQDYPLLDSLMEANCSSNGWQSLLDNFLSHFNLRHVNLYMIDSKFNVLFQEWSGVQPTIKALKEYIEDIFPHDTVHQTMLMSPECKWVTGNLEPYQTMLNELPGFHGWAQDHNFPYTTGCVLYRCPQGQVQVTFQRGKEHGPFTLEEEERFTRMSRFLAKAVELRLKIAGQDKNDLRLKSVLNKLRLPVTAVNEFGEIVAHNDAMLGFLLRQSVFKIVDNKLALSSQENDRLLKHSITKRVANAKALVSSFDTDSDMVSVDAGGDKFIVGTSELSEKDDNGEQFVGALLFVASSDLLSSIKPNGLKNLFGLTQAEATVCSLFANNLTLKEIAAQENKSVNTVREQLQNCYLKTNTHNQLELMNLLASLPVD